VDALTPDIARILAAYLVLLFSISLHESAHAWAALKNGDDTAARLGRISLNPFVHIDPVGTVLLPLIPVLWGGAPLFGWAKPTPVLASNFRQLARGQVQVAGAGPASNFLLAILLVVAFYISRRLGLANHPDSMLLYVLAQGVYINAVLSVFNMIPLPPLDGSWIASWGLPRSLGDQYDRIIAPYGQWLLILLLVSPALAVILAPVRWLVELVLNTLM
jgi:Zn-dependent protease